MSDSEPQAATAPRSRDKAPKARVASPPAPRSPRIVLRYVGDGSVFQSGIPNRDITTEDRKHLITDELAELAVATGTHRKV